mmetsp:Transcript_19585/g.62339  ORF Transcript_19585/g.62339 Transcript_19585/m.62339 type:complete len:287 (-) Transcript_19585:98-958(-)
MSSNSDLDLPKGTITVAYWSIRGLGAPLRMMALFSGKPVRAINYIVKAGEGGGWDLSNWTEPKVELKKKNPLMNLPYVEFDGQLVVQTNACFSSLGRVLGMMGSSEAEMAECEQILCEVYDLRNKMTGFAYGGSGDDKATAGELLAGVCHPKMGGFAKLELWLKREVDELGRSGTFIVGDKVSAPDFHLWEMLEQFHGLATFFFPEGHADDPLKALPHLARFYEAFKNLPENKTYLESPLYALPYNNKMAKFASAPGGGKWTPDTTYVEEEVTMFNVEPCAKRARK